MIAFIANTVCFGRFWVKMVEGDETTFPFVLQLFIQMVYAFSFATYHEFDRNFTTEGYEYMAHTLIAYLLKNFSLFVKHTKLPNLVRLLKTMDH